MKRLLTPLAAALAALAVLGGALFTALPAFALTVVSHGYGHLWDADGRSWLGSHVLDDGNLGLCLQLTKAPPEGSSTIYSSGNSLGWYSRDDTPRLAYLARNWLLSHDPIEASAAQLAAWSITGLEGHDDAYYAQRANGDAAAVLDRARQMRAMIDGPGGASRSVTATVNFADIEGNGGAGATVQSDLFVDFLSGGVTKLAPDMHAGAITLTGATFDDGTTHLAVRNGEKYAVHPIADTPASEITAEAEYTELPYGDAFWVAEAPITVQTLLVPPASLAEARATTSALVSTDLPFFPAVSTQTSTQAAVTGAAIHDTLELSVATGPVEEPKATTGTTSDTRATASTTSENPEAPVGDSTEANASDDVSAPAGDREPAVDRLDQWGTYTAPDGQVLPIPVTIRSTLLGPLVAQPAQAPEPPDGSGVVCRVQTLAEQGPARYTTPDCVLPAPGYYVWVETIDPADTPAEKGGARVRPWRSPFGTAAEVTLATTPPPPTPPAPQPSVQPTPSHTPPVALPPKPPNAAPPAALPHSLASTGWPGAPSWALWSVAGVIATGLGARLLSNHERFHRRRR